MNIDNFIVLKIIPLKTAPAVYMHPTQTNPVSTRV